MDFCRSRRNRISKNISQGTGFKFTIVFLATILTLTGPLAKFVAVNASEGFGPKPVPSTFNGFQAVVIGDVCNLRGGPSTGANGVGTVTYGTELTVKDYQDNWAKVTFKDGDAWIAGWLVDINLKTQGVQAKVTCTDVNMRQGPDLTYQVVSMTQKGQAYAAEVKRGEWIKVSLPGGGSAWIFETLLQLELPGTEKPSESDTETCLVTHTDVNFRNGPGTSYSVIGMLSKGDELKIMDEKDGWIQAVSLQGVTGWVAGYLTGASLDRPVVSSQLAGKTIVVDPGHGGTDPGVISSTGVREKDITLAVSMRAKSYLEALGAKVIMTRSGDYTPSAGNLGDLDSRVHIANSNNVHAFISIHINSFPSDRSISGVTGFFCPGSSNSQGLANAVARNVSSATGMVLRNSRSEKFRVLLYTKMPATLLELGFMTNQGDLSLITRESFQDSAAKAIADGIAEYFGR